jgi:predicted N-acyltransferase
MPYDVRVLPGIGEADQASWDHMVGDDNLFNTHAWLHALDAVGGASPVVLAEQDGRPVGGLPCWRLGAFRSSFFSAADLFGPMPGPWEEEFLWLGPRRALVNEIVVAADHPEQLAIAAGLLRGARDLAVGDGLAGTVMPYLSTASARLLLDACPSAVALLHDADANLTVPPGGMTEVLAVARSKDRKTMRKEIQAFEAQGYAVTWEPLGPIMDVVAELVARTQQKYGNPTDANAMRQVFVGQENCGLLDRAVVSVCRRGTKVVGAVVHYRSATELYARYLGFDYAALTGGFEYFVLAYYVPLDWAAQQGIRRYRLATAALGAKVRRGAKLSPLVAVVQPAAGPALNRAPAAAHNRRVVAQWRHEFDAYRDALTPDWNIWED